MDNLQRTKVFLTPIEVELGVDENGMTTAKKLYNFLELSPSNYSKWCRTNIVENSFAEEKVDYWAFVLNDERGGQATTDYKLTAHFAKKLLSGMRKMYERTGGAVFTVCRRCASNYSN